MRARLGRQVNLGFEAGSFMVYGVRAQALAAEARLRLAMLGSYGEALEEELLLANHPGQGLK